MVEIPEREIDLVLKYLRPLASPLFLSEPRNDIDRALAVLVGWQFRATLSTTSLSVSSALSLLSPPVCALLPSASVPPSPSSISPSRVDVP